MRGSVRGEFMSISPYEFITETIQKARKEYVCECCGKAITKGDSYARRSSGFWGDPIRMLCTACNDAVNAFCDKHEYGRAVNYCKILGQPEAEGI